MSTTPAPLPDNAFFAATRARWRAWLTTHHTQRDGVWLVTYKASSGKATFDYNAAVEEALCFGWVDSKPRALDAERTMLWFAPRKPKSGWSGPNKERVQRLTKAGLMHPAGLATVRAAKASGTWTALDAVEALEIPPDLSAALQLFPDAAAHFDAFPRSAKRGILEWIINAKRPETRAKRVEETARLAAQNVRANQWSR